MNNELSQKEINKLNITGFAGNEILFFEESSSTFDLMHSLDLHTGLTVVCAKQNSGSGRLGRNWESRKGGVYLTFALMPPFEKFEIPFITLVCAVGVCKVLNNYVPSMIKWPNDIVSGNKKICGILTRNMSQKGEIQAVLVGIGINVNNSGFGDDLPHASSISDILKEEINENKVLESVLNEISHAFDMSEEEILTEYKKLCLNLGKEVKLHFLKNGEEMKAICTDILPDGTMAAQNDTETFYVNSGEVSLKGIY